MKTFRLSKSHAKKSVIEIIRRLDAGEMKTEIARDFSVSPATIAAINRGITWSWLTLR